MIDGRLSTDEKGAVDLLPQMYDELCRLAAAKMANERDNCP
jgi:hypothetical protein